MKEVIYTKRLDDCELSIRAKNCLRTAGIETVADLLDFDKYELLSKSNFGKRTVSELENFLHKLGLEFKERRKMAHIDLEEVKTLKADMQREICKCVSEFEKKTSLEVNEIHIYRHDFVVDELLQVCCEVKL